MAESTNARNSCASHSAPSWTSDSGLSTSLCCDWKIGQRMSKARQKHLVRCSAKRTA